MEVRPHPVRGLAQPVELWGVATQPKAWSCPDPSDSPVIGLVVSRSYPDLENLAQRIADLDEPGAIWVCAETDVEAKSLLEAYDPVMLPLNPWWRVGDFDGRRDWRDLELLRLCERLYVFQKAGQKTKWNEWAKKHDELDIYTGLRLEEAGAAPARKRAKGRKPVGV